MQIVIDICYITAKFKANISLTYSGGPYEISSDVCRKIWINMQHGMILLHPKINLEWDVFSPIPLLFQTYSTRSDAFQKQAQ